MFKTFRQSIDWYMYDEQIVKVLKKYVVSLVSFTPFFYSVLFVNSKPLVKNCYDSYAGLFFHVEI